MGAAMQRASSYYYLRVIRQVATHDYNATNKNEAFDITLSEAGCLVGWRLEFKVAILIITACCYILRKRKQHGLTIFIFKILILRNRSACLDVNKLLFAMTDPLVWVFSFPRPLTRIQEPPA